MYKLEILNLLNHNVFEKWFYSEEALKKFKKKCKYSKEVKTYFNILNEQVIDVVLEHETYTITCFKSYADEEAE